MATVRQVEVLLLGTGGPSGWPEAGCSCASCSTAAARGTSRAPACALVDEVLLLDAPAAAAHAGRDLSGVRTVLLTGAQEHPADWVGALGGAGAITVLGPPDALEPYRVLGGRLQVVAASAGDRRTTAAGHQVRAVGHGSGLAWDVVGPDGTRLLYAARGGALHPAEALPQDAGYDVVLAGFGSRGGPAGSPSGLATLLAALRRQGAVTPTTDVRAVGYGHREPMPDVLQHHLAAWGVRDLRDGDTVPVERLDAGPRPPGGRTLVLGGVRSGKSALAEQLVAAHPYVTYVATGGSRADDVEWQQRVSAHRARRPGTWQTLETTDLVTCIRAATGAVLIDCLGTWLTAALDRHGVWDGAPVTPVEAEVQEVLAAWRASTHPLVAVSNEVGSGVVPTHRSGRLFRDLLGRINAQVAAESETVLLTVAGVPLPLRVRAQASAGALLLQPPR